MSYRTHCDWCGKRIAPEDDQAVMPVTIQHRRGRGTLDARWAEETKQTRHFCASPKEDTDRGGRNRAGLVPEDHFDSCYDRAIAAIEGTELGDPGMGMEWRLVPVESRPKPAAPSDWTANYDAARGTGGVFHLMEFGADHQAIWVLVRAGIVYIDDVAETEDHDLLVLRGIGPKRLADLRRAVQWYREKAQVA